MSVGDTARTAASTPAAVAEDEDEEEDWYDATSISRRCGDHVMLVMSRWSVQRGQV